MSDAVRVSIVGGQSFAGRRGEVLLDAALGAGIDLPHDCRSGLCGTCRVDVVRGRVDGCEQGSDSVLACQARLAEDLTLSVDERPPVGAVNGVVASLRRLSEDVFDVSIRTKQPLAHLPGQYAQFTFAGFPSRCFSPSLPLTEAPTVGEIRLHVQRVLGGQVSDALGKEIGPGRRVRVSGPFGSAYLRPGGSARLVLVASGTGFAPVWSIAQAALRDMPDREIVVVASAKSIDQFYMGPALLRLSIFPRVTVYAGLRAPEGSNGLFFVGDPIDMAPELRPGDVVYGCGAPAMVEALAKRAAAVGARCHADAFSSPPRSRTSIIDSTLSHGRRLVTGQFPGIFPTSKGNFSAP